MFLKGAYASRRSEKVPNQVCGIPNGLSEGLRVTMLTKSGFVNSRDTMTTISFVLVKFRLILHLNRLPHSQKLRAIKFEIYRESPHLEKFCMLPQCTSLQTSYLQFLFDCVDDNERRFREAAVEELLALRDSAQLQFKSNHF